MIRFLIGDLVVVGIAIFSYLGLLNVYELSAINLYLCYYSVISFWNVTNGHEDGIHQKTVKHLMNKATISPNIPICHTEPTASCC